MTDKDALEQLRSMVEIFGQVKTAKRLDVAQSLLSMVLSGQRELTPNLKEKLQAARKKDASSAACKTAWFIRAGQSYIDVDVEFGFPWLDKSEADSVAVELALYCQNYILAFAESRMPEESGISLDAKGYPEPVKSR